MNHYLLVFIASFVLMHKVQNALVLLAKDVLSQHVTLIQIGSTLGQSISAVGSFMGPLTQSDTQMLQTVSLHCLVLDWLLSSLG